MVPSRISPSTPKRAFAPFPSVISSSMSWPCPSPDSDGNHKPRSREDRRPIGKGAVPGPGWRGSESARTTSPSARLRRIAAKLVAPRQGRMATLVTAGGTGESRPGVTDGGTWQGQGPEQGIRKKCRKKYLDPKSAAGYKVRDLAASSSWKNAMPSAPLATSDGPATAGSRPAGTLRLSAPPGPVRAREGLKALTGLLRSGSHSRDVSPRPGPIVQEGLAAEWRFDIVGRGIMLPW
jgi:hypothetical protein